jgi:hypothetical protein
VTSEELDEAIAKLLADPEAREELERMRAQCPHQTLAQLGADKLCAEELFGV